MNDLLGLPRTLFLVATLLSALRCQQAAAEPVTEARVAAAYVDAAAACAKAFGGPFEPALAIEFVGKDELFEVLVRENLPIVELREPDADKARSEAETVSRQLAEMTYAKYSWADRKFLVCPPTWNRLAQVVELPELTTDAAIRAVLVHELCHAHDDRRFGFAKCLETADSVESVLVRNAVIEGSAQVQTRRICGQNGWEEGFAAMTAGIGQLPKDVEKRGALLAMIARSAVARATFAYHDGERFVAAVLAADPEKGAERVFRAPPMDQETVLNPGWYLVPSSRPALLYDLEPSLERFVREYDPVVWQGTRANVTGKQIATGLTLLPRADVDAFVESLRNARFVQLVPTANPQSKLAMMIALEFDSERSAARWIDMAEQLSKRKDETMTKGLARILGGTTERFAEGDFVGVVQQKRMKAGGKEFDVASIDVQRGRIVVETVLSGDPMPVEAHRKLVLELVGAVARKGAPPAAPEAGKPSVPAESPAGK
jgi:hypothetical protein